MDNQQVERQEAISHSVRRACLVDGCPCKDIRIVSQRRTAFFAAWAREHGETADRIVQPDPSWSFDLPQAPAA